MVLHVSSQNICKIEQKAPGLTPTDCFKQMCVVTDTCNNSKCVRVVGFYKLFVAKTDTLEDRREELAQRFFRRNVLDETSCLHYL